jgi:hypothetical protein
VLEKLIGQLPDRGAVGDASRESAKVDDVVNTGSATIRAVAAPQSGVRIEPEAGGVVIVERAATDEGVRAARGEDEAGIAHLVERGASGLDAVEKPGGGRGAVWSGIRQGFGRRAQKRKKGAGEGRVERSDGQGMQETIELPGGVERRSNGTGAGGLEFAAPRVCRRKMAGEEEKVEAAWSALSEGGKPSATRSAPVVVGGFVIPIGDDQAGRAAEKNGEIGVGVEEPLAGAGRVSDAGLVRTKAGLEMLGARLEWEKGDAQAKPAAGAAEASHTQEMTTGGQWCSHSYSRSAMALRTEDSSMTDF